MRKFWRFVPVLLAAGCVAPLPAPPPAPVPRPQAPPPPVVSEDWRDIPLTPGTWLYQADANGSSALFGRAGSEADFILRCDLPRRTVIFSRAGVAAPGAGTPPTLGFTTSAGARSYAAVASATVTSRLEAHTSANDSFLDQIAFSRGRFLVTTAAMPRLVLPAWAEVGRVIEDCRK